MKFKFNADEVMHALQLIVPVVNKKNSMPILDDILFEVSQESNVVKMRASDTETEMLVIADIIESDASGSFCVNADRLVKILSKLSGWVVSLSLNEETKEVNGLYHGGDFTMTYDDASEFPKINTIQGSATFNSVVIDNPTAILNGIKGTIFATSNDEIRPALTGVYFDFTQQGLVFVGTNGQIMCKHHNTNIHIDTPHGFILPKKPAFALQSYISQYANTPIDVRFNERIATFSNDNFVIITRLIESRYPNYSAVIPTSFNGEVFVNKKMFLGALARTMVFSPMSELVKIDISESNMEVQCQDFDYSTSSMENVYYAKENGYIPQTVIGFKGSLLVSILKNIGSEEVRISYNSASQAVVFSPYEETPQTETNTVFLIMPMKID